MIMTVSFDKKLAELDAYLQMLIEQSENLDKKLESVNSTQERDGLLSIKSNLESLLGTIKHAIVLLQIAKVSIQTSPPSTPPSQRKVTKGSHPQIANAVGGYQTNIISSSAVRDGATSNSLEDEEDDDDAFFDAADEQQQPAKVTSTSLNSQAVCSPTANDNNQSNSSLGEHIAIMSNNNTEHTIEDGSIDWDALYDEEEEDLGSMENQGSVIKHLMSQIRIGMDLTKVVLPTFILERRSLLEMYADFFAHPDLFSSIVDYETPEERMVQLVKWYLSAFHAGRKSSVAKKPYNPILGEIFLCHWSMNGELAKNEATNKKNNKKSQPTRLQKNDSSNSSNSTDSTDFVADIENFSNQLPKNSLLFVAEQVSHHPPVSAFYAENPDKLISCCAHIYTKSKYLGLSVGVHNIGQGVISLLKHNETYTCTFPSAYGRSILTVPWVELGGSVSITCEQTGYSANIEFLTKPFYGGKKHRVIGDILRPNKEPFMNIDGEWNGVMYSKSPPHSNDKQIFVDTTCLPVIKKNVRSISSQETFESRNVWKEVTRALKLRDVINATEAKSFIEQRQRDLLKDRQEKGVKWKTRYFKDTNQSWSYAKPLAERLNSYDST